MYSCGPPHMDVQKQDDQPELTYSNYVKTQDVTLKTCRRRWMIGRSGERGSGISVQAARHDDEVLQEEFDSLLRKIKNRKGGGIDEISPKVWKTRKFDDILLRHCNAVYNQNTIDRWTKGCILPFPKKDDLSIAKNYRGITLTPIAAKIYNALLRNRREPKTENIHRKNQNGFRRNRSTTSQILTNEGVHAKNLEATLLFVDNRCY